jgi:hypothetical protein
LVLRYIPFIAYLLIGSPAPAAEVTGQSVTQTLAAGLPIMFEPAPAANKTANTLFGRVNGGTVTFLPAAMDIKISGVPRDIVVSFAGAERAIPRGEELQQSETNYLLGNDPEKWRIHVANYSKVVYSDLYRGIDAIFYGNGDHLEHDFVVKPGADYRQIRMNAPAGSRFQIEKDGSISLKFEQGALRMDAPSIYQNVKGKRVPRQGMFDVLPNGDIGFVVADYDPSLDLVIDPVLDFSTYLSFQAGDPSFIATDANGNSYVTGVATLGYPVTGDAFSGCQTCPATNGSVTFISKLSPDGSKLVYSTVMGDSTFAQPSAITVDSNGNAIVAGFTGSPDFPTKAGQPFLWTGGYLGFLVSLSPDGSSLNYSTLLGSSPTATHGSTTYASAVALDTAGNVYVSGETGDGFFVSPGALNQAFTSGTNVYAYAFLAKFDPTGSLAYSAVLGTDGRPSSIAIDDSGNAYLAGTADNLWPTTSGVYISQFPTSARNGTAPFVMKVAPDAKSIVYSTFLDGASEVKGISVTASGSVFVAGNGAPVGYPTTPDAFEQNTQTSIGGPDSGNGQSFLTELNASGSSLVYSTMSCTRSCSIYAMTADAKGNIWLAGRDQSAFLPFVFPLQSLTSGASPVLLEFDPSGKTLEFSTYLGGLVAQGEASGVAVDPNLKAHVSGAATYGMYTTPGAYNGSIPVPGPGLISSTSTFVAVVDPTVAAAALCITVNLPINLSTAVGTSTGVAMNLKSCGAQPLTINSITTTAGDWSVPPSLSDCPQTLAVGQICLMRVLFAPTVGGTQMATLTIATNASMPAILPLTGNGLTTPGMVLSATSLIFGVQQVGTQSAPQTITISNPGTAPLNGIGFGMQLADESVFPFTSTCGLSLAPGASCTVSAAFKPATAGTRTATLTVEDTSGLPFQQVTLTGGLPFLFGIQANGSATSTVISGNTANYLMNITPAGGFSGTVNLSCVNLPTNASCAFSPASLALANGSPANFTLAISTQTVINAYRVENGFSSFELCVLLFLAPITLIPRRNKGVIWLAIIVLITGASGCGGSGPTGPRQQTLKVSPGIYSINVTATDSSGNQSTQTVSLIVQ